MTSGNSYTGTILRIDLGRRHITCETVEEAVMKKYIGGAGLGAKYLYENVPPGTEWNDPGNILFFGTGPLGGTIGGTGTLSVVTKGPQTNGAVSTQANGFFGAFLRFSGFHGLVIQGKADDWVYLYLHDGIGELIDARHLLCRDTWEMGELIGRELRLSEHQLSTFSIGPAGENLVRFACIVGDRGHVASHGGAGAVMGSKKLKAIVAKRSQRQLEVANKEAIKSIGQEILQNIKEHRTATTFWWGTSMLLPQYRPLGVLPIKNLTATDFPEATEFGGQAYRPRLEMKRHPCWACQFHHCHIVKIREGPYAGYVAEEPEFEDFVAFGPLIGQTDPQAVIVLNDINDRLGMDANETGWLLAMLMECYQRGIITRQDTDGIELTWGNVDAVRAILPRIARREGFGDTLAEGTMRTAAKIGGEASDIGIYLQTGAVPRGHDHRARWEEMLDVATSPTSTLDSANAATPPQLFGLEPLTDPFSPQQLVRLVTGTKGRRALEDSLAICSFTCRGSGNQLLTDCLNAITGWDWEPAEVSRFGHMLSSLLRCFDIRHGRDVTKECPSPRYSSTPTYGMAKGKSIAPYWDEMITKLYQAMGWDKKSGIPQPETLAKIGLDWIIKDMYPDYTVSSK